MIYTIYKLINMCNGVTYTGCTSRPPEQRKQEHFISMENGYHHNPLVQYDFNRGHKFSFKVIKRVHGKKEAIAEELKNTDKLAYSRNGRPDYDINFLNYLFRAA